MGKKYHAHASVAAMGAIGTAGLIVKVVSMIPDIVKNAKKVKDGIDDAQKMAKDIEKQYAENGGK